MSADALYAEFAGIPKASVMASCEQLLKLVSGNHPMTMTDLTFQQLLQTVKTADGGVPLFKAKSLEEAKKYAHKPAK